MFCQYMIDGALINEKTLVFGVLNFVELVFAFPFTPYWIAGYHQRDRTEKK